MLIHSIIIIQEILLVLFGIPLLYLFVLSFCALTFRDKKSAGGVKKKRHFALIIPAHNEEKVIEPLLDDLKTMDYPNEKYEVYVIADNCTDNTAKIVRKSGITALERHNSHKKGKGYALHWGMELILRKSDTYDAVIILDADNHILPNFLNVLNSHMEKGAKVIQGYITLKPEPGSWSSESTRLGYTLNNYVRALGRKKLGFPTSLKGNGMCFSPDVLRKYPWKAYSLAEDLEYGLNLLSENINVVFAPELVGYAISPRDPKNAESQRERWEMGRYPLIRNYAGKLLSTALRKASLKHLDAFVDLIIPPLVNMMGILGIFMLGNLILWLFGFTPFGYVAIAWFVLMLLGFLHVQIGLLSAAKADSSLYRVFAYIPRYAIWKVKIYLKVFFKGRTKDWVRTTRE